MEGYKNIKEQIVALYRSPRGLIRLAMLGTILAISQVGFGQISSESAIESASNICRALGISFDKLHARAAYFKGRVGDPVWIVGDTNMSIHLYPDTGRLWSISNIKRDMEIRQRKNRTDRSAFADENSIWKRGRQMLRQADIDRASFFNSDFKQNPDGAAKNEASRGRASMTFEEHPHGYPTHNNGNSVTVTIDLQDGSLIEMFVFDGWSYATPNIKVTQAEAEKTAFAIASRQPRIDASLLGSPDSELQYSITNDGLGIAGGDAIRKRHEVRLCYRFSYNGVQVMIDSETGQCVGGTTDRKQIPLKEFKALLAKKRKGKGKPPASPLKPKSKVAVHSPKKKG